MLLLFPWMRGVNNKEGEIICEHVSGENEGGCHPPRGVSRGWCRGRDHPAPNTTHESTSTPVYSCLEAKAGQQRGRNGEVRPEVESPPASQRGERGPVMSGLGRAGERDGDVLSVSQS